MKMYLSGSLTVHGINGRVYWIRQDENNFFGVTCNRGIDTLGNGLGWKTIGPALKYINASIASDKQDERCK